MPNLYDKITDAPVPTEIVGYCPKCKTDNSKIIWGWDGIYYDLICSNGHFWTCKFKEIGGKNLCRNRLATFVTEDGNIIS